MVICCIKTKEVLTPPPSQTSIPLKSQLHSLIKKRPVIILILGQFILGCVIYGRAAMLIYYWEYNAGDATTYGIISLFVAIVGTGWLGNVLFKYLKHQGKVCAVLNFVTVSAVLPAIGMAVLAAFNYVARGEQSPEILSAINWFITMIPAIISAVNVVLYLFYPISTEKHQEIMKELIGRRRLPES